MNRMSNSRSRMLAVNNGTMVGWLLWFVLRVAVFALLLLTMPTMSQAGASLLLLQPRVVRVQDNNTRNFGPMMLPEGSPWCGPPGNNTATYWFTGHSPPNRDLPYCEVQPGVWRPSDTAVLDEQDLLNGADGPKSIDRHNCAYMDINDDGILDVMCTVGANKGTGNGFNEVYLTTQSGTLEKVYHHGLYKYPTMRSRDMTPLKGAVNNNDLVLVTTNGVKRTDGRPNQHRMFRKVSQKTSYNDTKFFEEVKGPWIQHFEAKCVIVADFNNDGTDDFLLCDKTDNAKLFLQKSNGDWTQTVLHGTTDRGNRNAKYWNRARLQDMNNDGIPDLVVVPWRGPHNVRVFLGMTVAPYFNMEDPYYELYLDTAAPDVEVLDVNGDGIPDIYVVQVDFRNTSQYCKAPYKEMMEQLGQTELPATTPDFVPPLDTKLDILLVGRNNSHMHNITDRFSIVEMNHALPGCGFLVQKFGDQRLALAQGTDSRVGPNYILEWTIAPESSENVSTIVPPIIPSSISTATPSTKNATEKPSYLR